ncbi:MAG: carbohydrate ABC transporter permease [Lachnospiraceae bacterium]|nr:carbohydrate ABC transporter permease [Lachnospiraceae bacterium]
MSEKKIKFKQVKIKREDGTVVLVNKRRANLSLENVVFTTLNTSFLIILAAVMVYPMLNVLAVSFNEAVDTTRGGIYLWPRAWTLRNYEIVLNMPTILTAFYVSVARLIVTVITNLIPTTMLAYVLSRRHYLFNKPITIVFVVTMYFNAGMIPNYIFMQQLGLLNTFTVYWLPGMISAFNLIVIRTYIRSLSESLIESAKIDGASEFRIFAQIVTPLCMPVLATITLFVAVGSWNDWFTNFLYNPGAAHLTTLQFELQKLLSNTASAGGAAAAATQAAQAGFGQQVTPMSIRSTITVVTALPILVVYPFLQRYFVNGLMLGGVKE